MKTSLRVYIFGLMSVFFVSTTGVAVYKHYCNQDKMVQSYFLMLNDNCDMPDMGGVNNSHDCCHSDNIVQMHDDCCSHNMELYQINSDLIHHDFKIEIPQLFSTTHIVGFSLLEEKLFRKHEYFLIDPPPILTTPKRLSLFQTYLI